MIKKQLMAASLAFCAFGTALANNYNAPLVTERGPLRYDLTMKRDKWLFSTWTAAHSRWANRSFLCHGTDTSSLPSVIFGKETFTIQESFEQNPVVLTTGSFENSSLLFALSKFTPAASYTDHGMTVGGRFEYPIWQNQGRIGLRAALPFKTVRMERDDQNLCQSDTVEDFVIRNDEARMVDATMGGTPPGVQVFTGINRYKMSLLAQLRHITRNGTVVPALKLLNGTAAVPKPSGFYGDQYKSFGVTPSNNAIQSSGTLSHKQGYNGTDIPFVIIRSNGVFPPFGTGCAVTVKAADGTFDAASPSLGANTRVVFGAVYTQLTVPAANNATPALSDLLALEPTLSNVTTDPNKGYAFVQDRDYTNLVNQPGFDNLWVTPVFNGNTLQMTQVAAGITALIDSDLLRFQQGAECLLAEQCFVFQTYERTGLGDLDLDAFYEHTFNDNWRAELWLGVRFPTGGSSKFCGNPYRVQTGNGNHYEVKVGGLVGWQTPCNWLALKADLSYSWVLEATEQRAAAFKGATITNVGPCVCANVDWGYLTGHVDFNFYHPKSRKLGTMVGYEIYYKTEDNVCFKQKTLTNHFLGGVWSNEAGKPADQTVVGSQFSDYAMTLDNKVAEHNTERIAHRLRAETHWHAHKYWSFYAGGAYTFAGKNIFRESEMHGGIAIRY